MPISIRRRTQIIRSAAIGGSLILGALAVSQASYAAFSSTTAHDGNSWSTGTLVLSDDAGGSALFSASNLKPGDAETKIITVTSKGSIPGAVKLYTRNAGTGTAGGDLASYIFFIVQQGTVTDGVFTAETGSPLYDGRLQGLINASHYYGDGVGKWSTTGSTDGETKSYKITWAVDRNAPNSVQGKTLTLDLVWEVQSS